jgi:uncharacterized repeat protein (TIGR03803 family)
MLKWNRMKVFTALFFALMFSSIFTEGQHPILYGTTGSGNGGIFKYTEENNELKNVYRPTNSGIFSKSEMTAGTDGIIYGVAHGGPLAHGVIFSIDPATNKYTIRKKFREVDGRNPNSALVAGKDGKLYGTTEEGGKYNGGVIFSFDPVSSVYRVLHNLDGDLYSAAGGLTLASDGLMYGIVQGGLYSFDPISKNYQKLLSPEYPGFSSSLVEAGDGNLYIVWSGSLYSYSLSSKQLAKRIDFDFSSGRPTGTMFLSLDGKLYGTSSRGGANIAGTIFSFDTKNNSLKIIHDFASIYGGTSGNILAEGEDGELYGMRLINDPFVYRQTFKGSIFYSIDKNGNSFKIIRSFDHGGGDGGLLDANEILTNMIVFNHKLYGIALSERESPYEYIFSYDITRDIFQKIIRTNLDKGIAPTNLMQASDGRFYGTTEFGGGFGEGGIFSFNPATSLYTMLLAFNKDRGYGIQHSLVQARNSKIYGFTLLGGEKDGAAIFSYEPDKSRYVVERSLRSIVIASFTLANDGKLYSTIQKPHQYPEDPEYWIFSYNPDSGEYKELFRVLERVGTFTKASNGRLYAISETRVYSYDPIGNSIEVFAYPPTLFGLSRQKLIEASDHKLYGMAFKREQEGYRGKYLLYSIDPLSQSFAELFYFEQGTVLTGSLLYASDGNLYGTTSGGINNNGTLISFNPLTKTVETLRDFQEFNDRNPGGGLIELNMSIPPIVSITDKKMFEGETVDLTVSLNRISMEETILNYRTVPGTASDKDFTPVSGQLVIPAGEISTRISVSLLEDELIEKRETFTVVLQKANDAVFQLGDSIGVINIKNGSAPIIPPGGEIITIAPMLSTATECIINNELVIRATPNPTSSFFSLHISGISTERVSVTVTNLSGQILDKFDRPLNNAALTFGHNYKSGSYFVRIVDGEKSKVIKLIKTSK